MSSESGCGKPVARPVLACVLFFPFFAAVCGAAEPVTVVDFTRAGHDWRGNPRTRQAQQSAAGWSVDLTGEEDPWVEGPAVALPAVPGAQKLAVTLEAETSDEGAFQMFFAVPGTGFSEGASTRLLADSPSCGVYRAVIPWTAGRLRFRLDPPGCEGRVTLRRLRVLPLVPLAVPAFGKPPDVHLPDDALRLDAGPVSVRHDPRRWNAWTVRVGGQVMAESNPDEAPMYRAEQAVVSVPVTSAEIETERTSDGFVVRARVTDAGGAHWRLTRRFTRDRDAVRVETSLTVDARRGMLHLPWVTLFAGRGSFGTSKGQALLPGVEYLADEPSSSEKEIRGPAANRRIVDDCKVCYPLMALTAQGHWCSLSWEAGTMPVSPLFDSPDRIFNSGGHVLGVWSPAVGEARFDGELALYGSVPLEAGKTVQCTVTLCGGKGEAVTEAVECYVARTGLPPLPQYAGGFDAAVRLLAFGWLDSASHHGTQWRHAVFGSHFPPARAEDVPGYLLWLAANTSDPALKARLNETSASAIAALPAGSFGAGGISHVKRPTGALLYGDLEGLVKQAGPRAKQLAAQLADGRVRYTAGPEKVDYASTLGSDHCNGYTAMTAEEMLQAAALTGDEAAIAAALQALDKMTARYAGQVPRGAQPWEMPLHTPDIVASARLTRCYVLGYLLSGKPAYLEQARYWAWTGVAMVYLVNPVPAPVGRYATIGVIGATNWQAPNWIGQPVQWCGLVYRSALEDLARVDARQGDVWRTVARGITLTGLQMCFPVNDKERRGGLLPDYYLLHRQKSDGPAINPGTLEADLAGVYGKIPMYTATRLADGSLAHAPGIVKELPGGTGAGALAVSAWPEGAYRLLITRVGRAPEKMLWNGTPVTPHYLEAARALIVPLKGSGTLAW